MYHARLSLVAAVMGLASLLAPAAPAAAAPLEPAYRPRPVPDRMPGWDWWRIYPWSPYNYGRNPYNPIILPYPPPYYPHPYYGPYGPPTLYGEHNAAAPDGAMFPTAVGQQVLMPHPSGPLRTPPPGAAIVQVRVPDASAHVLFDGERTYTEGETRYFVTPELPDGQTFHYSVSASWKQDGDRVTREREVQVAAGHTTVVDFRKLPAK